MHTNLQNTTQCVLEINLLTLDMHFITYDEQCGNYSMCLYDCSFCPYSQHPHALLLVLLVE